MNAKIQYQVETVEGTKVVGTLKEVSTLLGEKVTKARINNGEFADIITELVGDEDINTINEGVARAYIGDDQYVGIKLVNPVQHSENNNEEDADMKKDTKTYNEEEVIKGILNAGDVDEEVEDESTEEDVEDESTEEAMDAEEDIDAEESTEEDTDKEEVDVDKEEDTKEPSEDKEEDKPSMKELLERMKELNAKKQVTNPQETGKGSRTKTIEFTGEFPEVGFFKEKKELQKFYKQLTDEQLEDWIELEGLTYKASENEPINRMRRCMAILNLHFPKNPTGTSKKKSKYADYTTEQLLEMALDNDVEVKEAKGDERILRMYTIIALRNAGLIE